MSISIYKRKSRTTIITDRKQLSKFSMTFFSRPAPPISVATTIGATICANIMSYNKDASFSPAKIRHTAVITSMKSPHRKLTR